MSIKSKVRYIKCFLYAIAIFATVFFSFTSSLLIYLSMLILAGGVVYTMFAIENVYIKAKPIEKKEETNAEEIKYETAEHQAKLNALSEKLIHYITINSSKGHSIKNIYTALINKYPKEFIDGLFSYCIDNKLINTENTDEDLPELPEEKREEEPILQKQEEKIATPEQIKEILSEEVESRKKRGRPSKR